eukprot:TRINITY_DN12787_c0_g5_i1.p1 TRINITY_DN12787_c0_g5~~TRINITY_DN12787_c0_g5_i1.p1  ORF type:complete len:415 (-),score=112.31 TRINITY_DN12787_c0_g5_i1:63-1307(-)
MARVSGVPVELKEVLGKRAGERQRWLTAVLRAGRDGRVEPSLTALFDILAHRKFADHLNLEAGRRMLKQILSHADIFSAKQQKILNSGQWPLAEKFGENGGGGGEKKRSRGSSPEADGGSSSSKSSSDSEAPAEAAPAGGQEPTAADGPKFSFSMGSSGTSGTLSSAPPAAPAPKPQTWMTATGPTRLTVSAGRGPAGAARAGVGRGKPGDGRSSADAGRSAAMAAAFDEASEDDEQEARAKALAALRAKQGAAASAAAAAAAAAASAMAAMTGAGAAAASKPADEAAGAGALALLPSGRSTGFGGGLPDSVHRGLGLGPLGMAMAAAPMKRRAASNKNPAHEGLEAIKAQVLRERGIKRSRSRRRGRGSRSRSRRKDKDKDKEKDKDRDKERDKEKDKEKEKDRQEVSSRSKR